MLTKNISCKNALVKIKISILFICCCIGLPQVGKTQPYEPLAVPGESSWKVGEDSGLAGYFDSEIIAESVDTINGKIRLYRFARSIPDTVLYGYIRQDSNFSKAWFTPPNSQDEILIYDMELSSGDTFNFKSIIDTGFVKVKVDSVFIKDNRKHIRFDYLVDELPSANGNKSVNLYFIEGIGATTEPNSTIDYRLLICASKNEKLIYEVDEKYFNNCSPPSFVPVKNVNKIKVYPNPFSNTLNIEVDKNITLWTFRITDLQGMLICTGDILEFSKIPLNNIKSGIYILSIRNKNQSIINTIKLIKL